MTIARPVLMIRPVRPSPTRQRLDIVAVLVREFDRSGARVEKRHVGDIRLEHAANLLADEVEQRRDVELAGELLRHLVDGRKLGGALLRLGEEPRVLDGDGGLQREPDEEVELGLVERLAGGPPDGHRAFDDLPRHQRRDHQPLLFVQVRCPLIWTARGSAPVSLMNSARPLCSKLPMMPWPSSISVACSACEMSPTDTIAR